MGNIKRCTGISRSWTRDYFAVDFKTEYTGLRKTIKTDTFLRTKMPVPPINEQDAIVNYLDWKTSKIFSISNYFLRFSNEFRRIKGDDELDANNWYEYVEYGTTNPLTILLQRNGFSRESARFIKENPEYVVKDGSTGKLKLKASLSKCGRTSVENEVEYIRQNVPGIFADEEE